MEDRTLTGIVDGVRYKAPDMGRHGIHIRYPDGRETTIVGVAGRYRVDGDLYYLLPELDGEVYGASVEEVGSGLAWAKIGKCDAADWECGGVEPRVWHQVADVWPVWPFSPRLTDGILPPMGRGALEVKDDDGEGTARMLWGGLAGKLSPQIRYIVGLTLTSPWMETVGAQSSLVSLWGRSGGGKTMIERICEALYSTRDVMNLAETRNDLILFAQQLSYLPIIQDCTELEGSARTAQWMKTLLTDNRHDEGQRWCSLAITAGCPPLDLSDKAFSGRAIDVCVDDHLWFGLPLPGEDKRKWWRVIVDYLPVMGGHPWRALTNGWRLDSETVDRMTRRILDAPASGTGNIEMLNKLAMAGCQWMAEWTGCSEWSAEMWQEE